jgi:hypothetical protein
MKQKGGAAYESGACFMALQVSKIYQSQLLRPLDQLDVVQSL